jgi:3-oxoacyl-[acyl-carrier-protein] synthase-3
MPERVRTNDDLSSVAGTSNEWICTRMGIVERRIAAENDAISKLGVADIELRIFSTLSPEMRTPATVMSVERKFGLV